MYLNLNILNPEQKKAVEEIDGPSMIIAGAGSGKTRVLTFKIAYLLESGVSPYEILSLTFTNKAASEMKERISKLVASSFDKIWMGTFHSIFARLLRIEAEYLGFNRNFSIYDSDDSANLIKQIMINLSHPTDNPTPKAVQNFISNLKNKIILPLEFSSVAKSMFEKKIESIYHEYQKALFKNNAMDFDDLLLKPIELFKRYPELLDKYQERFKFILVDEYQDTNKAQYTIIKLLAEKYKNLSIVGDDAQSIYKWRGAEIQNIFDFRDDFKECKVFKLEQNYRSTQNILTLAGNVIKNNKKQIDKNLWTENHVGENIHLIENMTDRDEAVRICRNIFDEMQRKKINFKDFVILYRTNVQSRTIEDALRQNNIPYLIIGGIRFYQRKEIKDILAFLKIIVNPKDNESLLRVLNLKAGIGKTTVDKLIAMAEKNGVQIFDVLKNIASVTELSSKVKNLLVEVNNYIYKYQYLQEEIPLKEMVNSVLDEIGILRTLRLENTVESEERIGNIQELLSAVAEFSDTEDEPTLELFLQKVSLVADIDNLDNQKNAVTLMTIHSAKGLEFPVVFITGLEEGLFPVIGATMYEDELEEERRLFYVAITRAKSKLYMSFANQRYRFGTPSFQMKSRFIKEIPENISKSIITYEGLKIKTSFRPGADKHTASGPSVKFNSTHKKKSGARESENEFSDSFPDIQKGVTVTHNTFGKGTVLNTVGKGLDKKAEIYFDDVGIKKIILKYAKMTVHDS
ncbi:MAG TPA: 3'-5' exonuclease [Ignavibacteria bacterium]|nr:DNA helicase [Bacteroidota bacterium]HRI83823.1 3'-5' exonuclease [Ignavibacteria bacterium]HRJ99954.1 3'-5' exonuclease [Ignavibacteria bacterium]